MKVLIFLTTCLFLIGCSSTDAAKTAQNREPLKSDFVNDHLLTLESLSQIRLDRCHTQLTDFYEKTAKKNFDSYYKSDSFFTDHLLQNQKKAIESLYHLRMSLRAKVNEWALSDAQMSYECAELAYRIQQHWTDLEEEVAFFIYQKNKDWPLEQKVFMNSNEQLLSNPLLPEEKKMTSLSDLQNGDVVVQSQISSKQEIQSYFIIYKQEDGSLNSLEPQADLTWTMNPLHRSNGWLKRSAERLTVLRHQSPEKAQEMVTSILDSLSRRRPSSLKLTALKRQSDIQADPQLVNMMEWKNYLSLYKNRQKNNP